MMLQLLMKDLRIQKPFIAIGFVFVGFFFFALGAFEGIALSVPAAIFGHFLIVVASKMDERNNNGRMLASFPLRRSDIVGAKYAGIPMFMALAFLLTASWRLLAALVLPAGELPWFNLQSSLATVAVMFAFYSIYFPLFFSLGAKIAQVLDLIVIFAIAIVVMIVLRVAEWAGVGLTEAIRKLLEGGAVPLLTAAAGCLALLAASWLTSLYVYERKNI